ncbi:MAG TPA: gamma-glutamyl-gamma-aminobutyrate hydrolase family protein [Candidatus Competibacteraceae bacterium]|nr:gamma-glutamyl-gamma-aminobutyrate hydrolase family protein [Candidatus Competibacteraceae bacterium]
MDYAPLIGITLDEGEPGGYSAWPWYALRQNYFSAVAGAGALPVALPHEAERVAEYLARLDGVLVSGGAFDIDPALYGAAEVHASVHTKPQRTRFEWALLAGALQRDLPVLGVCGGMQLLNVVLGGTLIQDIGSHLPAALPHEQPTLRHQPGHSVQVMPDTRLARITGRQHLMVNSAHHQAVARVAPGLVVNAVAPDGVIEGIECPDRRFCLGLQWHPEFLVGEADRALLAAFVAACREAAG